ncbi:hypothetical protein F4777DRAFT_571222 [Nemania sp. FL0916]|nr:hypothetical protein F4777DRAFT_571222 [Nemania sp. FL0916]
MNHKNNSLEIPVRLLGILATWGPDGEYKPSCALDYYRFQVKKPQYAELQERKEKDGSRRVFSTKSCAEWTGLLEWCNQTEVWPTSDESSEGPALTG